MATRVKIAINESLSGVVDLSNVRLTAVQLPSAWTAADLTFQMGETELGAFGEVFLDPGTGTAVALQLDAAASQVTVLTSQLIGDCFLKVRSGTSGSPVVQLAAREIILHTVPL